ncbi:multiheme c-type cytochrome [Flagellimonas sp. CMM7]|uniref:multiheme c-type cytochrome n=1 Tax=Flagellimonas sp. CMM7 TaxID=2654676 RepID=UPI0013D13699|nr:multiheme c-type cytochrome [Flagellimonas sp. CMM7]UII80393.1 hypothetical protein LV704_02495 [Flagellimonas sp. CMM7]
MKPKKNIVYALTMLLTAVVVFWLVTFFNAPIESDYQPIIPIAEHSNGQSFAGSTACAQCHSDIYSSHIKTAHFNSSAVANELNIKGSFKENGNVLHFNENTGFMMTVKEGGFYQEALHVTDSTYQLSNKIDMAIGSGTRGQTYLSWKNNDLFQLQVSYFAPTDSWVNSPGYPKVQLADNRPIGSRCLECHVTYAERIPAFNKKNVYNKSNMVFGIDCERCHGPGAEHVNMQLENPKETKPLGLTSYKDLTQQQRLDACALCHSGVRKQMVKNPFSFVVGDTLINYSLPDYDIADSKELDVHGNQYGLLLASTCFKGSENMDCATCHDPHKKERGNHALFNSKCMNCHNAKNNVDCAMNFNASEISASNCIACHMPLTPSKSMSVGIGVDTANTLVEVRTHLIAVYADRLLFEN